MSAVSVIICAYASERWATLCKAVAAVQRQTLTPAEVIVVVDHNAALFKRVCEELNDVRAVSNNSRQGLSGARNTGVTHASSPIVAFLDDDAVPAPDWLERLVAPYSDGDVMATGGRCDAAWVAGRPRWFPPEFDWVVGCSYRGLPEHAAEIRNPIGAAMSVRRAALAQAGTFREDIGRVGRVPLGCEETELAIRIRQRINGARILHVPSAVVAHAVPEDRCRLGYFLRRCYAEGLSKAHVVRYVGRVDGLDSERTYVSNVLLRGVLVGILRALRGERGALGRAAMIVAGLALTTVGYGRGRLTIRLKGRTR